MNDLNSTLIEGTAMENAKFVNVSECRFTIYSHRYLNNKGDIKKVTTPITIEAQGKLAESCKIHIHKWRNVRAVGRLKQISTYNAEYKIYVPHLIVEAEHIEFRPEFKKDKKEFSPESAMTEPFIGDDETLKGEEAEEVDKYPFGHCTGCGKEFNSELRNEYGIAHCPWCGKKIDDFMSDEKLNPSNRSKVEND